MLIKLSDAIEVDMWKMFDFGYVANQKELKEALQAFSKSADESTLYLALKVIRALAR